MTISWVVYQRFASRVCQIQARACSEMRLGWPPECFKGGSAFPASLRQTKRETVLEEQPKQPATALTDCQAAASMI